MALEGKLVILREQRREDMQELADLRNDLETQAWSKTLPPDYTLEMLLKRYEGREFSFDRQDGHFALVNKETGEWAGHIVYSELEPRFAVTVGIAIPKKFWGTGVALDAQEVILRFSFLELGVRVVRLWTHGGNPRAVELAKKSGFQISGRSREAIYKDGQLCDNLVLDLLREEYFSLHPELEDSLPPVEIPV